MLLLYSQRRRQKQVHRGALLGVGWFFRYVWKVVDTMRWEPINDLFYYDPKRGYGYECSECGYDVNAWDKARLPESCPKCKVKAEPIAVEKPKPTRVTSEEYEYGSGAWDCSDEEYNYKWKA